MNDAVLDVLEDEPALNDAELDVPEGEPAFNDAELDVPEGEPALNVAELNVPEYKSGLNDAELDVLEDELGHEGKNEEVEISENGEDYFYNSNLPFFQDDPTPQVKQILLKVLTTFKGVRT